MEKITGDALNKLKEILSSPKTLGYYDPKDRTQAIADASSVSLGCVLIQFDKNGRSRTIAYGNKSLTDCEKRYCQTEKEALALVWSVEHVQIYLFGMNEFELVTDHKPLEAIFNPKSKPCARIERWVIRLQSFKFKVVYKSGKLNVADSLSRLCFPDYAQTFDNDETVHLIAEYATPNAITLQDIKKYSKTDEEITKVHAGLYEGKWDESVKVYKIFETELCFYEGILLRGNKLVIPGNLRQVEVAL